MSTGAMLLFGIAIFALVLGAIGCYIASNFEAAERKRRMASEARRMPRTPWYTNGPDGRTPTL